MLTVCIDVETAHEVYSSLDVTCSGIREVVELIRDYMEPEDINGFFVPSETGGSKSVTLPVDLFERVEAILGYIGTGPVTIIGTCVTGTFAASVDWNR